MSSGKTKQKKQLLTARKMVKKGVLRWRKLLFKLSMVALIWLVVDYVLILSSDATGLTTQVWFTVIFAVLVWMLTRKRPSSLPNLRESFYNGSTDFIKQFLILLIWMLYFIPFIAGTAIRYQVSFYQFGATSIEMIAVNVLWLSLTFLTMYWLMRAWLAPLHVHEMYPIAAIKASWKFTKAKAGWVSRGIALSLVVAVLPLAFVSGLMFLPGLDNHWVELTLSVIIKYIGIFFTLPLLILVADEMKKHEPKAKRS